jgi:glycosyltransferase involved in cell wall biosynthesis
LETEMQNRLAIFLPSLAGGGAEKSMIRLAIGIAERGYPVDLVLARAEGPYRTYLTTLPECLQVVDLKAPRVLLSLPALTSYLRRSRPDALLSTLDYANVVALWARYLARTPTKVAVNEQNTISLTSQHSSQFRQRLVPRLVRHFYPWANHIIGNSQGVANDLSKITGLPQSQIQIIYNPVVTTELQEKAKANPKHPWLEMGQPPVVLAVGRLMMQKDFPTLIQAFADVRQTTLARLLILGEGPDRPGLETLIRSLNLEKDVSLLGFVENPYAYMSRASLFVLSSRWEGLPTVLIEALYCGVPVISTDCRSGPREILADGQYGKLVPIQDPVALAEGIKLGLAGQTPRPSRDSWRPYELDTIVEQYIKILIEG